MSRGRGELYRANTRLRNQIQGQYGNINEGHNTKANMEEVGVGACDRMGGDVRVVGTIDLECVNTSSVV